MRISHVHLWVRDLAKSLDFYEDVMGLVRRDIHPPSERVCQCVSPGTPSTFAVVLTEGLASGSPNSGIDHFSFEVPTTADVIDLHRLATCHGTTTIGPRVYQGYFQAFLFDPDGYKIEILTRDLPGSLSNHGDPSYPVASP